MSGSRAQARPDRARRFVPGFAFALEERLGRERLAGLKLPVDAVLATVLAVLAAASLVKGFDAFEFVTGDALFSIQILDFGAFEFRPPPPNRLVPDIALHWLVNPLLPDPYLQKLAVGLLLFVVSALSVGLFRGLVAFALFGAIMVSNGFEFLVSAMHYSLPLTVLACLLARGTRLELPVLFVFVFSNPLVLLPLAFVLVEPDTVSRHLARAAIVAAALAVNTAYSEFSATLLQILAFFPVWYAGAWVVRRLGVGQLAIAALCVMLPLAAAAGLVDARYAVPVAASLVVVLFPARSARFDWRYLAFPVLAVAIFLATVDHTRKDRLAAAYACLADELRQRGIDTIAAGHWTAKPLYFAAKQAGLKLTIAQTDFQRNASHPWMAPHSFYGEPTRYAVRDSDTCTLIDPSATYCGQARVAAVESVTPLCGLFELYRYETPVPANHTPRPAGKADAILRNLGHYVSAVTSRLR